MRSFQEPMACQSMHSWTFTGLIGAFVDLAIAYLLLCGSAVAFFASKLLSFFGLSLPCPCNGVFVNPNSTLCLQRLLVDLPMERVSSVQIFVKGNFPFSSTWEKDRNNPLSLKFFKDRDSCVDGIDGFIGIEGEASCSSTLGNIMKSNSMDGKDLVLRNESNTGSNVINSSLDFEGERFDLKGKANINQRPRNALRRRRKVSDYGKVSSVSEYSPLCSDGRSPYGINHTNCEALECGSVSVDSGACHSQDQDDMDRVVHIRKSTSPCLELESVDENNPAVRSTSSTDNIKNNGQTELSLNGNENNRIRMLEQALEQEHAARSALHLELEKERSAAATAADEAMAMILRLQEEKASVEMEARQFQRMIEEKSTYDAEEMCILKEIIVRREREKHFLEKEVEAYRSTVHGGNANGELASTLDVGEDPLLLLQQLSESIDNNTLVNEMASVFEEKYTSVLDNGIIDAHLLSNFHEHIFADKIITVSAEQEVENDNDFEPKGVVMKSDETHDVTNEILDMNTHVYDVHVVDNTSSILKETQAEKNEGSLQRVDINFPGTSRVIKEPFMGRSSSSDLIVGLPPLGGPVEGKSGLLNRRGNSMSAVDNERIQIDSEVGWLRERLRIVQEEREKLNFSMERRDREMFQVQLLEDIACQLREIRQLTSPGKSVRQASLPLLPPKATSKKRRHRSVSVGVYKSS